MLKKASILLAIMLIFNFTTKSQETTEIKFTEKSWEEAIAQAKKDKKILFVDAYTDWCNPCKWMAENTFKDKEVAKLFNENFISIQINMETDKGRKFGKTYPVTAYPTIFFINGEGDIVKTAVGAQQVDGLLKIAKLVLDPTSTKTYQLKKKYDDGDKSEKIIAEYLQATIDEDMQPNKDILNAYLKNTSSEETFTPFIVFIKYIDRLDDEKTIFFAKNYQQFSSILGKGAEDKFYSLLNTAVEEIKAGKEKRQYIYDFIKHFSGDDEAGYNELKQSIDNYIDNGE